MVAASGIAPTSENALAIQESLIPAIISREGQAAIFAAEEFFYGKIRIAHTRRAYLHSVKRFLAWCEQRGLDLPRIAPTDVEQHFDDLPGSECRLGSSIWQPSGISSMGW